MTKKAEKPIISAETASFVADFNRELPQIPSIMNVATKLYITISNDISAEFMSNDCVEKLSTTIVYIACDAIIKLTSMTNKNGPA